VNALCPKMLCRGCVIVFEMEVEKALMSDVSYGSRKDLTDQSSAIEVLFYVGASQNAINSDLVQSFCP
jgi:hypothetical protein